MGKKSELAKIPVYPEFASYRKKFNIADCTCLCEDDRGRIAFLSEEAKAKYLGEKQRRMGKRR